MRPARVALVVCLLLPSISGWSQQTPAQREDPQAVSVITQSLNVAGGVSAIRAVRDYTATGTISYPSQQDAQGPVTILGMNGTEFRMNANLPPGMRSWAVNDGVVTWKSETGSIRSTTINGPVPSSDAYPFQTPLFPGSIAFPDRQLVSILGNPSYTLVYKGLADVDGRSTHDIEVQRSPSGEHALRSRDIFIDAVTFQIVKVSETLPKGAAHAFHYSDYRAVAGVLMPFSITEEVAGQQTWAIQLSQFNFNTGLQATSFAIQ